MKPHIEPRDKLPFYERLAQSEADIRMQRVTASEDVFARLERDLTEAANEVNIHQHMNI